MSNKPKIYANCKSGCAWETVHRSEFEQSASHILQYPNEDGSYTLEIGKEYKIFANHNETAFEAELKLLRILNNNSRYFMPIATPRNDEYADFFVFKLLQVNGDCMVYELGGVRYKYKIETSSLYEVISAVGIVSNATKVLLYNADAEIVLSNDVDNSLTKAGQAADAKVVGDRLNEISSALGAYITDIDTLVGEGV